MEKAFASEVSGHHPERGLHIGQERGAGCVLGWSGLHGSWTVHGSDQQCKLYRSSGCRGYNGFAWNVDRSRRN